MAEFQRTTVGGVSVSRMIIGTNWFLGIRTPAQQGPFHYSYQTAKNIADIIRFSSTTELYADGDDQRSCKKPSKSLRNGRGGKVITIYTPVSTFSPGTAESEPERC